MSKPKAASSKYHFDRAAAKAACDFFSQFLRHSKGKWAGKPFDLLPWQRNKIIRPLFGWKRADGTRRYRRAYIEVPKKNGKALDLKTRIPTPDGWVTMADIKVGDRVFDERGAVCNVIAATGTMLDRPCYSVTFTDGAQIVADAEHEWLTLTRKPEKVFALRTTKEIAGSLRIESPGSAGCNHTIPVAGALILPQADLLVDPYVFGAWLGDGHSASARFTCGYDDLGIVENIRKAGVSANEHPSGNQNSGLWTLGSFGRRNCKSISLQSKLRKLGVLNNKHIPNIYLRASEDQRRSLLQGLMDTDGHATKRGQLEFVTISRLLCDGVMELMRSLGLKPTLMVDRARINGKDCGPRYRIQFWAFSDYPVFRLPRKLARQKHRPSCKPRSTTRQILHAKKIESVPVRCIEVDSPSRLYLAGDGMIPTHNSTLSAGISLFLLVADGEPGAEIYNAAADRDQASIVFNEAANMVRSSPALSSYLEIIDSRKTIFCRRTMSTYRALSAEVPTKEGLNIHGLIFDELHAQKSRELWDTLVYGGASRRQPLQIAITTAGIWDLESIGWEQHDYASKVLSGSIQDDSFFAFIAAAEKEEDWTSPAVWKKANPSYGVIINKTEFAEACAEAQASPAKQNSFRRYRLDQWVAQADRWLDVSAWDQCAGPWIDRSALQGRLCFGGMDLSTKTDMSAFVLVFPPVEEDELWRVLPYLWVPEDRVQERLKKGFNDYRQWVDAGFLQITPGNVIDYEFIHIQIADLQEEFNISEIAFDPWNATQSATALQSRGLVCVEFRQGFKSFSEPMKELEKLVLERKIAHGGHPVLRWMADNLAVDIDPAGNLKPTKAKSGGKIDGIVALVMALGRAIIGAEASYTYTGM